MALELKERHFITWEQYEKLLRLNIEDRYKCSVLIYYILDMINTRGTYVEFQQFLSSDSGLWHLSVELHQLSMSFLVNIGV